MTNPIDFLHGSSFANALHSISNNHLAGLNAESRKMLLGHINDLLEMVDNRNLTIENQNRTIQRLDMGLQGGFGFIQLLEEEIEGLRSGVISDRRFSGNGELRANVRDELEALAKKVDVDLARTGGRFSGNRIHNLRDVLHMRIDEFCEYGVKHRLISPDFKTVYTAETPKKLYAFVDENKVTAGKSPDVVEVLMLQRILNKNYDLAVDANGQRPEDYAFKPVNLIAAVGFTVKQLCDHCHVDETPFVGHKYADPAPEDYGRDPANDGAAALLHLEYKVLEDEADQRIRQSDLANKDDLIAKANARHEDIKARLAAKMAIVRFAEVQADLYTPAG